MPDSALLKMEAMTTAFSSALNATQRPMWLNFHCLGPWAPWCAAQGNSWRIGPDHHDSWESLSEVLLVLGSAAKHGGPYRWTDPDFLMTSGAGCDDFTPGLQCPGMTPVEYKTEFTLWSIAAASMLVATDVRALSPLQQEILLNKELLAVVQDPSPEAGGLAYRPAVPLHSEVWARTLADGSVAVGLFNRGNTTSTISVDFSRLALPGCGGEGYAASTCKAAVRDLWAHADRGVAEGHYASAVEGHGTVALRLTPQR